MPPPSARGVETPVVAKMTPLQAASSSSADTSQIIRDVKGINLALTKTLETKPLSDPDVEFQRQNLRRRYQTLLFSHHPHPSSSASLSSRPTPHPSLLLHVEGLWIQTTHAIIALHRTKITALSNPPQPSSPSKAGSSGRAPPPHLVVPSSARHHLPAGARPVELRKQLTKFRAFLSAEIAFYSTLAGRFVRSLGVEDARPFLSSLGIVVAEGNEVDALITETGSKAAASEGAEIGRKVVTKLLVCLGDLERYKEMYSERERERKGRLEAGKSVVPQEKRFERAREVYSRARELMPENGNPFNQLAVISTYIHDPFSATYFYLRALSILDPFVTARGNLQSTLRRPLDAWEAAGRGADVTVGGGVVDEARLKKEVVLLQAMFTLKSGRFSHQSAVVLDLFRTLLLSRSLAVDTILRNIVLPISTHWDGIFSRPAPRSDKDHARSKINVEAPVLEHILDLVSTLLEVAAWEIKETLSPEQKEKLKAGELLEGDGQEADATKTSLNLDESSKHLSTILRRALPTLRIVSKWLIVHSAYLSRTVSNPPTPPTSSSSSSSSSTNNLLPSKITHLWKSYSALLNALSIAFPFSHLQALVDPLEEDLEMKAFGPLGKRMGENWTSASFGATKREDHPNEEMLMRIWDLERDGKRLASGASGEGTAGVRVEGGRFVVKKAGKESRRTSEEVAEEKKTARKGSMTTPPPASVVDAPTPVARKKALTLPSSLPPASLPPPIQPTTIARERTPTLEAAPSVPHSVEQPRSSEPQPSSDDEEEAALNDADSGSHASTLDRELELASVSTETEDDPVNRAMRAALDDEESAVDEEDAFAMNRELGGLQGEDEDERIVWPAPVGRRDTVTGGISPYASGLLPPKPSTPVATARPPPAPSGLTALDLLQQMSSPASATPPAAPSLQREESRSSNHYLFGSSSSVSSIWGSPVIGGSPSTAQTAFREPSRPSSGNWGSFAPNDGGRKLQDALPTAGNGFLSPPGGHQSHYNTSLQHYPSPELRFSNAPHPTSNGFAASPSQQTLYQPYQPQQQTFQPTYNSYQPNLYANGNTHAQPSSGYNPQSLTPSGGFAPPPPSSSPLNGFHGHQTPQQYSPSSAFGQQQYQSASASLFAPPGLGQRQVQQQQDSAPPPGFQKQSFSSLSGGGAAGRSGNPWG